MRYSDAPLTRLQRWGSRAVLLGLAIAIAALTPGHAAAGPSAWLMIGAATTTVDLDSALKIFFNEPVVENVVTDSELLSLFLEDNEVQYEQSTGGRYIETAQYFQLPSGVGARARGEYIPIPEGPVIKNSRIFLKKLQGVVEMEGDVMARVRGDMGAYLNWMDRALPDLVTRLDDTVDRMLLGYGAGIIARVNEASPSTAMEVDTAFGVTLDSTPLSYAWLQFQEGDRIVFSANASGNPIRNAGANQSAKILGINQALSQLTLDVVPTGVLDNDYIFHGDGAGVNTQTAAGDDREIMGLLGMVDDGTVLATFQNLSRATYRLWNAVSIDGDDAGLDAEFTGSLNETLLTYADDETAILGGGKPSVIVTSKWGLRSYWKSLKTDRTINDPRAYAGGKGNLTVWLGDRQVTLKAVRKMPKELCFGLSPNTFKRWEIDGFQWDDKTGSIWKQVTDGTGRKDAFYAYGNWYIQTGCLAPRKNFRIVL
jgi:hypothetical protein